MKMAQTQYRFNQMYDMHPLETIESYQNFGMDDIEEMSTEELKEEYTRAIRDKKDLEKEIEDMHGKKPSDYAIKERLDNQIKYIDKVRKKLNGLVSNEELKRLEKSVVSKYEKKEEY